jgi:hypothetical protein
VGKSLIKPAALIAVLACSAGKDAACISVPCPLPMALDITVTSAADGGPVPNATLAVTGPETGGGPCTVGDKTHCEIGGYAGTYDVTISAPGFKPIEKSVTVKGMTPDCGCATTETQKLSWTMTPTS